VALVVAAALPTFAATRSAPCVGGSGCSATLQEAVDAAQDGDTITIGAGTFAGGVVVGKSVSLVGAGAGKSVIKGGGPVLTLGTPGAKTQPKAISIKGLTITGGVNRTIPQPWFALGGGIYIPEAGNKSVGATVTIEASVISGNRVEPSGTDPTAKSYAGVGWPSCPASVKCPRAFAGGAGIESHGNLTLIDTTVRDNRAVTDTSFAGGGGIRGLSYGSLTLKHSVVTHNEAVATAPYGRWAWGGGIILDGGGGQGAVTISDSVISDNSSLLTSTYPAGVLANATGAAFDFDEHQYGSVTVTNTKITGNVSSANAPKGSPIAGDVIYIDPGSPFVMRDSVVSGNRVVATGAQAGAGNLFEVDSRATISNTRITGNRLTLTTRITDPTDPNSAISGTFAVWRSPLVVLQDSLVAGNSVSMTASHGTAFVEGAGIWNAGGLRLVNTKVTGNTARESGPAGWVRGGGIWSDRYQPDDKPRLELVDSLVSGNTISGSSKVKLQGGGVFSAYPVKRTKTVIAKNTPDQCFGC
jgi:hypothetical protein